MTNYVSVSLNQWFDIMMSHRSAMGTSIIKEPDAELKKLIETKVGVKVVAVDFDGDTFTIITETESDATAVRLWI